MTAKQSVLILLLISVLQAKQLAAQEYLDLWRNSKTDDFYLIQKKFNEYYAGRDTGRGYEDDGYAKFKRWEYFMEPRVYPSGKLINPAKLALDEEVRYGSRTKQLNAAHNGDWQSLGIKYYSDPRNLGGGIGRVNCIVPHPTDPQTLFAGTPAGGLWKATDAGKSWIPLTDGIPVIGVSGIAINPNYSDSIYILTGDGDGRQTPSTGVLLSVNGGDTWQSTGLQFDVSANVRGYKLVMHPSDPNILFAVTTLGIYKTTNGGINWDLKVTGSFTDLAFRPGYRSVLYAATTNSFFVSVNTGDEWSDSELSLDSDRIAIAVSPKYIYLLAGSSTGFTGLYRSDPDHLIFKRQSDSPNILGPDIEAPFDTDSQSWYDLAIAVSPANEEEIHIGGINCWKSLDGGETWSYTSYWKPFKVPAGKYVHEDIHALVFVGNTLYCGNDGGVSFLDDHAANWQDISYGLEITQFYRIGAPANDLTTLYGGTQDNGVNKWTAPDNTMSLQVRSDGMECVVDYTDQETVYSFINQGLYLYVTQDGGATKWNKYPKPDEADGGWVVPLVMHPVDHTIVYAGYNNVYKITDLGKTFERESSFGGFSQCVGLAISMLDNKTTCMYAAGRRFVDRCIDMDNPVSFWENITGSLPVSAAYISDVEVSAVNARNVWVSFSGYSEGTKVYKSADGGDKWINISGSLPNVPVNCITYHNNGNDGVYLGTDIGVFYRDNTMTDWIPFRNGMPNVIVNDLKITNNRIRACTFGRGIWESDLYGSCSPAYILSGDVTGYLYYEASDAITSTVNIKGGIGTSVLYKAANTINLQTGFKVVPESKFLASIGNCSGTQAYSRKYRGVYEGPIEGVLGIASVADSTSLLTDRLKVYPNIVSRQSMIEFYISKKEELVITLQNLSGKKVKKVLFKSPDQPAGNYQLKLDTDGLKPGKYLVSLQTKDYEEKEMMTVLK